MSLKKDLEIKNKTFLGWAINTYTSDKHLDEKIFTD